MKQFLDSRLSWLERKFYTQSQLLAALTMLCSQQNPLWSRRVITW